MVHSQKRASPIMKKITILLSIFVLSCLCAEAQTKPPGNPHKYPVINGNAPRILKWDTTAKDLGAIHQGVPSVVKFTFVNTGHSPIILTDVHPTCSCTAPDWTKNPVPPGQTGYVLATYNAATVGKFNKSIAVTTNEGEIDILVITGEVVANNPDQK